MDKWILLSLFSTLLSSGYGQFETHYMTEQCNADLGVRIGGRLETSTALTYDSLMDCYTSVSVQSGKQIIIFFWRFEVEDELSGSCVDYLNVHDGSSTSATTINEDPLCGTYSTVDGISNMTSSSNAVTLYFASDNTAVYRGFEIIYVAFSHEPCERSDFACNNTMCIDSSLQCDGITQCGDGSDEDDCEDEDDDDGDEILWDVIIGCGVALLLLLVILGVILYRVYDYYKWKSWLERNGFKRYPWEERDDIYEYPVTDKYSKYEIGHKGRREPQGSTEYIVTGPEPVKEEGTGSYLET